MKKIFAASLLSSLLLSACAAEQRGPRRAIKLDANPSALLAQEIAMEQLANEKGRSEAYREFAAPDAVLFVPELVAAPAWLKDNQALPPLDWEVHKVIISCDGKTGVTTGAVKTSGASDAYFTSVWQRYEKRNGEGKWLWALTHQGQSDTALKKPDFIETRTASCKGSAPATLNAPAEGVQMKQGLSRDQSLSWTWQYRPDKSRSLVVKIWDGEKNITVLTDNVPANRTVTLPRKMPVKMEPVSE